MNAADWGSDPKPDPADPEQVGADLRQPSDVVGADLLDELDEVLARFVAFPSDAARHAVALWAVHAHAVDSFDSSPRVALLSPEPGSGKTRTLEVLELLVPEPMFTSNASVAVLARSIDARHVTVLLDEADAVWGGKGKDHEELRAIVNSGHRRGATYDRMVGEGSKMEARSFRSYAAVALAGIGTLPDTVMQRSVVVRMRRRAPGEQVEPFRHRHAAPGLTLLRDALAEWVAQVADDLKWHDPVMPDGVTDRPADVWAPLLAVADLAGGRWPHLARAACTELLRAADSTESGSLGVRLLADLREVFGDDDALHTSDLLDALNSREEWPWGNLRGAPLDPRGLARLLRRYDAHPIDVKIAETVRKGYRREHLWDAWQRYLPARSEISATSATAATTQVSGTLEVADDAAGSATGQPSATEPEPLTCEVAQVAQVAHSKQGAGTAPKPDLDDLERAEQLAADMLGATRLDHRTDEQREQDRRRDAVFGRRSA